MNNVCNDFLAVWGFVLYFIALAWIYIGNIINVKTCSIKTKDKIFDYMNIVWLISTWGYCYISCI